MAEANDLCGSSFLMPVQTVIIHCFPRVYKIPVWSSYWFRLIYNKLYWDVINSDQCSGGNLRGDRLYTLQLQEQDAQVDDMMAAAVLETTHASWMECWLAWCNGTKSVPVQIAKLGPQGTACVVILPCCLICLHCNAQAVSILFSKASLKAWVWSWI